MAKRKQKNLTVIQAVGALGELSDKSDFSLVYSGTVLAKKYAIYHYFIVKNLWIYFKSVIFFLKKMNCVIFI